MDVYKNGLAKTQRRNYTTKKNNHKYSINLCALASLREIPHFENINILKTNYENVNGTCVGNKSNSDFSVNL